MVGIEAQNAVKGISCRLSTLAEVSRKELLVIPPFAATRKDLLGPRERATPDEHACGSDAEQQRDSLCGTRRRESKKQVLQVELLRTGRTRDIPSRQ